MKDQLELIDTTPLGLWADEHEPPAQFKKQVFAPPGVCPMRLMGGWSMPCPMFGTGCRSAECESLQATPKPEPPPTALCLHCHKHPTILIEGKTLFCSRGCRTKWIAGMASYANRMAKTSLAGEAQDLFDQ
jgi:hypothetical protein